MELSNSIKEIIKQEADAYVLKQGSHDKPEITHHDFTSGLTLGMEFMIWRDDPENPFMILDNGRYCQACGNSTTWSLEQLFEMFQEQYLKTREQK